MPTATKTVSLTSKILKAQSEMAAPLKKSNNPHFKSKFAGLQETMDVIEPALEENGLAHQTRFDGRCIQYIVIDVGTGEERVSSLELPLDGLTGNVWQQLGQAMTYLRRYMAQAFWGLIPEDDDANSAPSRPAAQRAQQRATNGKAEAPAEALY